MAPPRRAPCGVRGICTRESDRFGSPGRLGQVVFDGTGLGEGLDRGPVVGFSFVGEVFSNEEIGDLFLFGGEGFQVGDALELLGC